MLKTIGDARYRYLDMKEAEPGDRFYFLRHQPYSDTIESIDAVQVLRVEEKYLFCRNVGQSKVWKLRRHEEQIHCYVEEDPFFQELYGTFIRAKRIHQAKEWIRNAPPERFSEEVLQAIERWYQ